jgi:hypothetical protein
LTLARERPFQLLGKLNVVPYLLLKDTERTASYVAQCRWGGAVENPADVNLCISEGVVAREKTVQAGAVQAG